MTLKECREKRGWVNNTEIIEILENMQMRIRKRIPNGEFNLTKLQRLAIDTPGFWRDWNIEEPQNVMIQGATSAGKTLLAELAILDTLAHDRRKAIILVPLKSMVNERKKQFSHDMNPYFRVFAASSDYMEYDESLIEGDYDVAVIVYEKFFAMLSQINQKLMDNCSLLVVDELAMLSKEQRGPKLELALEIVRKNYQDTRIMCLATNDCSSDKICRWLKIDDDHRIFSDARPVALEEHILLMNGEGRYRTIPADCEKQTNSCNEEVNEEYLAIPGYQREWKIVEKKKRLLQVVLNHLFQMDNVPRILIFVGSRIEAASVASSLIDSMNNLFPLISGSGRSEEYDNFIHKLKNCEEDEGQMKLIQNLIPHGIAFHHAGLSTTLRELIEEEFQQEDSILKVIVATETLTIGVNMPFDVMIMLSNCVPRGEGKPVRLTQQEYRNYIGRAGRLGQSNHTGITYLFLEEQRDMSYYWKSYNNKEEIESALVSAKEESLASYYLSLLMDDSDKRKFTQEKIYSLFQDSLTHVCRENREFNAKRLYLALYGAYLVNKKKDGGNGKMKVVNYHIKKFGTHMAPYAFSMDTCIDIYEKFYKGKKNHGLPWGITSNDIDNDRYLLDILYHVCRHCEIENSSVLSYPRDNHNPRISRKAKASVTSQIKIILNQQDAEGNKLYELWEDNKYNDLYRLITTFNLGNEDRILEAAMRAVLLFYWTKGKKISEIRKITGFESFTKVIGGDIERIAEVVSFHLDAIYVCLGSADIKNDNVVDSFYVLQCRVKYGMTWNLVRLANKHIHGLDRNRLLLLEEAANKNEMKPVDYLYCAPVEEVEQYITRTQRISLMEALERRGQASGFNSLFEIVCKDAGSMLTDQQEKGIEQIYNFGSQVVDTGLYDIIRDTVNDNDLLPGITVASDGNPELLLWHTREDGNIRIGIFSDYENQEQISLLKGYFKKAREKGEPYLLLMPKCGENSDWLSSLSKAANMFECETVFDNEFFAMILANTILKAFVKEDSLTAFFKDARGIFTVDKYKYFSPENYIGSISSCKSSLHLICDRSRRAYTNQFINISELQTQIGKEVEYDVLPWGSALEQMDEQFFDVPIVLMLEREMITRSRSLFSFVNRLKQKGFQNNLLILASEDARRKWNEPGRIETQTLGECKWDKDFCEVTPVVLHDTNSAVKAILDYCGTWKPGQFTIGISYAHEDSYEEEQRALFHSDNALLYQVVSQLKEIYGEHQILFDQYQKAGALFDDNQAREKSLNGYRSCKVCLILWNTFTKQSENCIKEREAIISHCKESAARYIYLKPSGAPETPESEFALRLNENEIQNIVNEVRRILSSNLRR